MYDSLLIAAFILILLSFTGVFGQPWRSLLKREHEDIRIVKDKLEGVKHAFDSDNFYRQMALQDVLKRSLSYVEELQDSLLNAIYEHEEDHLCVALMTMLIIAKEEVALGRHHSYRGRLSAKGAGYSYVCTRAIYLLAQHGFLTPHDAKEYLEDVKQDIKNAG